MSYTAVITKIEKIQPHPNADRLNIGECLGFKVIISKEIEEGTLGVFFQEDGCLSKAMLTENNLYSHSHLNKDSTKKGMFGDNGRIRAVKLRGALSEGIWLPLSSLDWTGIAKDDLKDGFSFSTLNGKIVCEKYYTKATLAAMKKPGQKPAKVKFEPRVKHKQFKEHFDTGQLLRCIKTIPKGSVVSITSKCHGTSQRSGRLLADKVTYTCQGLINFLIKVADYILVKSILPRSVKMTLANCATAIAQFFTRFGKKVTEEYEYISGTRRTVINPEKVDSGFYKDTSFRGLIHNDLVKRGLHKGETLYYEIVGFTDTKAPIMGSHNITDPELAKRYGKTMVYSYGCDPDNEIPWRVLVYRITRTSPEGVSSEVPYHQLRKRLDELGLEYVPVFVEPFIYDGNQEALKDLCDSFLEGPDVLDSRHIREGVVIRVEHPTMETFFKHKAFSFKLMEGLIKEQENYVDEEEAN